MIIEPPFWGVVAAPAFSVAGAAGWTPPQALSRLIIRMSPKQNKVFFFIIFSFAKDMIK